MRRQLPGRAESRVCKYVFLLKFLVDTAASYLPPAWLLLLHLEGYLEFCFFSDLVALCVDLIFFTRGFIYFSPLSLGFARTTFSAYYSPYPSISLAYIGSFNDDTIGKWSTVCEVNKFWC